MYAQRILSVAFLAMTASLPTVMAETCSAVGFKNTNSAGFAIGGTTYSSGQGIVLYNEKGDEIGNYEVCDDCSSVCSDLIGVPTDKLSSTFYWAASCSFGTFHECHGSYGSQTHIDGEKPQNDNDFYGLGITTDSQCKISFEC